MAEIHRPLYFDDKSITEENTILKSNFAHTLVNYFDLNGLFLEKLEKRNLFSGKSIPCKTNELKIATMKTAKCYTRNIWYIIPTLRQSS